jgi:16S rRNA G1207 methylase RsmC
VRNIDVPLNSNGKPRTLKGPDGVLFDVQSIRHVDDLLKFSLLNLPTGFDNFIFPNTGNSPVIPACLAALNPQSKVHVFEQDAHDYRYMNNALERLDNVSLTLAPDMSFEGKGTCAAFYSVFDTTDRLLSFDIIERLTNQLPDNSTVYFMITKKRHKDFMKKLTKDFIKGSVIAKSKTAALFRGVTSKAKDCWSPRCKTVEVDAIDAALGMVTRPGVFTHGRVDEGGLSLYDGLELNPGENMLELGCGAGLVSLLAAARMRNTKGVFTGSIHMVDSHSRAIECAEKNIAALGISGLTSELSDQLKTNKKFDVVAGNPPYYANHRIAEYFIEVASEVLKKKGRLYIVSKHAEAMEEIAKSMGFSVSSFKRRGYIITVGILEKTR